MAEVSFTDGSSTPPFLAWALEVPCSLRTMLENWEQPDRTERHLRAVREFGRGVAEGRIIEDFCLGPEAMADDSPGITSLTGFRVAETLQIFGGTDAIQSACSSCPVNIAEAGGKITYAGCYGLVPVPTDFGSQRSWYQWWLESPLTPERCREMLASLSDLSWPNAAEETEFQRLLLAARAAEINRLPLHGQMIPAGTIVGRKWHLPPHCGRCGAKWQTGWRCHVCDGAGTQRSGLKRHVRGQRPFLPLIRMTDEKQAGELLEQVRMTHNKK